MSDENEVASLIDAARRGDQSCWNTLVDRFMPLVRCVVRRYRLSAEDASDVCQTTWLRLVEHLDDIREPERLAGWILVTARNESLRLLNARKKVVAADPLTGFGMADLPDDGPAADELLIRAERHLALLEGLEHLRPQHRQLLLLLIEDPPLSYADISERLGIPHGSIGPTRGRALAELRSSAPISRLLADHPSQTGR
jgi:RNA polymerase sigma factor (sigma-70 family)